MGDARLLQAYNSAKHRVLASLIVVFYVCIFTPLSMYTVLLHPGCPRIFLRERILVEGISRLTVE